MKLFFLLLITAVNFYSADIEIDKPYEELFTGTKIYEITSDDESIWFATYGHGILQYIKKTSEWKVFNTQNKSIEDDFFYCIAAGKDFVWAGTGDGLFTYDKKRNQWRKRKFAVGGELGNWIRSLCFDEEKNILWIGRFKNLTRYDVTKNKYDDFDLTIGGDSKTNTFTIIKKEENKYIWFGTEAGIHKYDLSKSFEDPSSREFINNKTNAFRNEGDAVALSSLLFEKNFIWFGTAEFVTNEKPNFNVGGIYKFNRRAAWERIDSRSGLGGNGIKAIEKCGNFIWASVYQFEKKNKTEIGKGIYLIDRITNKVVKANPDEIKLGSNTIYSLFFDGKNMWIGTDDGLWKVKIANPFAEWTGKKTSVKK